MLAQAQLVHAASASGFTDRLVNADGNYAAAPLPFAYDALEPVIDAHTVELHYNFHHKPAAAAANKAEEGLARARETGDFALVKFHEKELAFQLSSHILHTIYWTSISGKVGEPGGELAYSGERDHAFRRIVIMDSNDRDHPFRLIVIADHRFPKRVITMPE
ncbi:hypothetical protein C3743_39670 [Burkholderia contaminans]|uniref:superoxide dismutase n=2 Tax=Burkholderia contaminans TaxID=488447 RepID=A0A2S5DMN1_9BURK|nr:hypothetical protein C3743_39670 [Burkholderia contaminans]